MNLKAVQIEEFGGPEVLKTTTIEEPNPNENEVKIKLHAAGLNPNEAYTISGNYGFFVPDLPYVPGFDGAGTIEKVGKNVKHFKEGDRVFLSAFSAKRNTGTYAEKVVTDAEYVYPLPENVSFTEGAALGIPVFTAYRALFQKAKIKAGEIVLIHGASGSVGSTAVQMAKAVGAIVIGTSSTEEGRKRIRSLGADYALNHISKENKEELAKITQDQGPDAIIEILANANLETDTEIIADHGRVIVVGSRDTIEIDPRNLMTNQASITGMNIIYPSKEHLREIIYGVSAFLKTEAVKPLIGNKFTLDRIQEAYKDMMESSGNGRTMLVLTE